MKSKNKTSVIQLFHTGYQIIAEPDIRFGRKNADFGQGFYLSENEEFSKRWARRKKGLSTYLNVYTLDTAGLKIKRFARDAEWFEYIFLNRSGKEDMLADYDVITGPVANDTIYDTWGIVTSGFLNKEQALRLLMIGPEYVQTVIKTDRGAKALRFVSAAEIKSDEIAAYRTVVENEEEEYQERFAHALEKVLEATE